MVAPDPTWSWSSKDALILVDDVWVRLSAVQAVTPTKAYAPPAALIYLANGSQLHVKMTPEQVMDALAGALK